MSNENPKAKPRESDREISRPDSSYPEPRRRPLQGRVLPDQEQIRLIAQQVSSEFYSGPLPHPRYLDGFNKSVPGGANRILIEWEKQGEHDREMERQSMELARVDMRNQHTITSRGQVFALTVLFVALACASGLAVFGQREVAIAIFGFPVLGIAIAFLRGINLPSFSRIPKPSEPTKSS